MEDYPLPFSEDDAGSLPLHAVRPSDISSFLDGISPEHAGFLRAAGFTAASQQLCLLPGLEGAELSGAVLGLGDDTSPYAFGDLAMRLPLERPWRLGSGIPDPADAVLGYCLGAYAFRRFRAAKREPARLVLPRGCERAASVAQAVWMVRDLINQPANLLGPAELADAVEVLSLRFAASSFRLTGDMLDAAYPAVRAVGLGSARPPVVAGFRWQGSSATPDSPLVSLCGKGVVFDTGGYDLKPSAAMLRMKKDMGGAAVVLGVARALMEADLPLRLAVRIGCVENSVSGTAMRPSDVIATRRGLSVEIGNTDAEGRLVLADLLDDASEEQPSLLIDCATLTGAARVALGPDLPALFCNDDDFAGRLIAAGQAVHDPLWQLPLWDGYANWLDSSVADLNNVSSKPMAGAVTAALFLRRFVSRGDPNKTTWAHIDSYCWNDQARPGRPEGGDAQSMRALVAAIENNLVVMQTDRNKAVT